MIFKFKPLWSNNDAGMYGILAFFIVLSLASFIWLLCNTFLEVFFNMMSESYTKAFFTTIWVNGGIFVVILLAAIFGLFMYMQKSKYEFGGGFN